MYRRSGNTYRASGSLTEALSLGMWGGILFGLLTIVFGLYYPLLSTFGVSTTAIVTGIDRRIFTSDQDGSKEYLYTVSYQYYTAAGELQHGSATSHSRFGLPGEGEQIPIYYLPSMPSLNVRASEGGVIFAVGSIGIGVLIVAFSFLLLGGEKNRD